MDMKFYDYIVVGSGLFGSTFSHIVTQAGKTVLILEARDHVGGNVYQEQNGEISVHKYGPHIFHTNDKDIWEYVTRLTPFNNFIAQPLAYTDGKIYNLPFNMNTFAQLWNIKTPYEAKAIINEQVFLSKYNKGDNLEDYCLRTVGHTIYEKFIKGYSTKQWGITPDKISASIISRIPLRFTYDNNYFNDIYQGIPEKGYNDLIEKQIAKADIELKCNYNLDRDYFNSRGSKVVYTGSVDELFNYEYGELGYRSLRFENSSHNNYDVQGVFGIKYTDNQYQFTRTIEHKHFYPKKKFEEKRTILTHEYPLAWEKGMERYYPISNPVNDEIYNKYRLLYLKDKNLLIGGRLGMYKYYDMHQVIASAIKKAKDELKQ